MSKTKLSNVRCECCGQRIPADWTLTGAQLKAIRGLLGWRLGWEGPLPQRVLARLLYVSPRTYWAYENGRSAIPQLTAREALRLKDDQTITERKLRRADLQKRNNTLARRKRYKARVEAREKAARADRKAAPDPPF